MLIHLILESNNCLSLLMKFEAYKFSQIDIFVVCFKNSSKTYYLTKVDMLWRFDIVSQ